MEKQIKKSVFVWLLCGLVMIGYSMLRISQGQPLFRRHTRDLPVPQNAGGSYQEALRADDLRNSHYILIGLGILFLLVAGYKYLRLRKQK